MAPSPAQLVLTLEDFLLGMSCYGVLGTFLSLAFFVLNRETYHLTGMTGQLIPG